MTIKIILFLTILYTLILPATASAPCPDPGQTVKVSLIIPIEKKVVKEEIIEYTPVINQWRPDSDLTAFIKSIENHPLANGKTKLVAYKDYGYIAKGYGTRSKHFKVNTLQEAEKIMFIHLYASNRVVERYVRYELTKHQRNALVSLVYNIGPFAFKTSAALKALNRGDITEFKIQAFDPRRGFVCAGGKHNRGLMVRRAHELNIWEKGSYYTAIM
jgi:GH24 family phage-related lysozyme (muramidase)